VRQRGEEGKRETSEGRAGERERERETVRKGRGEDARRGEDGVKAMEKGGGGGGGRVRQSMCVRVCVWGGGKSTSMYLCWWVETRHARTWIYLMSSPNGSAMESSREHMSA
jgi:hypothetical protein